VLASEKIGMIKKVTSHKSPGSRSKYGVIDFDFNPLFGPEFPLPAA
jgi:hypothetical protein